MTSSEQIKAWIRQAEADLSAASAEAPGIAECHRRYWFQQSYEKSIKALALMKWTGVPDEREFAQNFLWKHSPLATISTGKTPLPKKLYLLQRELTAFMIKLDGSALLKKLDATTPTTNPDDVSYRYPFRYNNEYVPPAEYPDWDHYQGNHEGIRAGVARLINAVKAELRMSARSPK